MNHCYDCNSTYEHPGTCNCFAPGGKREPRTNMAGGTAPDPRRDPGGINGWSIRYYRCSSCGQMIDGNGTHTCWTIQNVPLSTTQYAPDSMGVWVCARCGGPLGSVHLCGNVISGTGGSLWPQHD